MMKPSTPHTRKKKLGSYPTLLVVFSITLALVVIGLFGLLLVHAQKLSEVVRENLEVQVYLDRDLPETELLRLQQDLGQQPFVAERNGKPQIRFVSKEEGARQLLQSTRLTRVRLLLMLANKSCGYCTSNTPRCVEILWLSWRRWMVSVNSGLIFST